MQRNTFSCIYLSIACYVYLFVYSLSMYISIIYVMIVESYCVIVCSLMIQQKKDALVNGIQMFMIEDGIWGMCNHH